MATVVFLLPGATSPWSRPSNWTDGGHTVEMVSNGGAGGTGQQNLTTSKGGGGGGGGGYYLLTYSSGPLASTVGFNTVSTCFWEGTTASNDYQVTAGTNGTSGAAGGGGGSGGVGSKNGSPATVYTETTNNTGGAGGAAGTTSISPDAPLNFSGGGGGGGAAGPSGNGKNGGVSSTTSPCGGGGGGGSNGGSSSAGSNSTSSTGANGGNGTGGSGAGTGGGTTAAAGSSGGGGSGSNSQTVGTTGNTGGDGGTLGNVSNWVQTSDSATAGVGGGGGGSGGNSGTGTAATKSGKGGNYGGGSGGNGGVRGTNTGSAGSNSDGLIVITYSPSAVGTATGTGTASAAGNAIVASTGSAAGTSTASATGSSTAASVGTPTNTFDPTFVSSSAALSNGNLTVTASSGVGIASRSVIARSIGKFYFEVTATVAVNPHDSGFGICNQAATYSDQLASTPNAFGFFCDGQAFWFNGGATGIGVFSVTGDVMSFAVDLDAKLAWVRRNGGDWNGSSTNNPATGVGGYSFASINPGPYFVGAEPRQNDIWTFNFGATAYQYTVPSGYNNWIAAIGEAKAVGSSTAASSGIAAGQGVDSNKVNSTTFDPKFLYSTETLSNGNLTVTSASSKAGVISTRSVEFKTTGKFYFEETITLYAAVSGVPGVGFCNPTAIPSGTGGLEGSPYALGYFANGYIYANGPQVNLGVGFTTGDVIGMAVDFTAQLVWFRKNGGSWMPSGDPVLGTGGYLFSLSGGGPYYVATELQGNGDIATANFGASSYQTPAPAGYYNWASPGVLTATAATSNGGPPLNGATAYYPFDGDGKDRSGGGIDGTVTSCSFVSGPKGQAAQFTSSGSSIITAASSSVLDTDTHSIAFWYRLDNFAANTFEKIFGYEPASSGSDRSPGLWTFDGTGYFTLDGTAGIHWRYDPGNTGPGLMVGPSGDVQPFFTIGTWYHVVGIKNGGTFSLYINGRWVQDWTGVANPKATGSSPLYFGRSARVTLDEFRIYNRVLTATEVSQLYLGFLSFGTASATSITIRGAAGTAVGAGTASAVGSTAVVIHSGAGTATGTGTATATGRSTFAATGTAAGTGTASAVGAATDAATGTAAGSGTASATTIAIKAATGNAAGTGTAAATGAKVVAATGTAAGSGTAASTGASFNAATGTATGTGTASAVGAATDASTGTATGTGTASAVGAKTVAAIGTATATGAAVATGAQVIAVAGTATGTGTAVAIGASYTTTYLRPDADDATGTWTNELGGSSLFPSIDEAAPANDADYIQSGNNPSADIARLRMSDPSTIVSAPLKVTARFKRGAGSPLNLTMRLKEGTTTIATWTYNDIASTFVTVTETLTPTQFSSISNMNNLFVELQADAP